MVRAQTVMIGIAAGGTLAAAAAAYAAVRHNRDLADDYVLDVTQEPDSQAEADRAALLEMRRIIAASPTGRDVLARMDERGTRVTIVDGDLYRLRRPHSGGVYNFVTNEVQIPRHRAHHDTARAALTLVHEAQHAVDMPRGPEALRRNRIFVTGFVDGYRDRRGVGDGVLQAISGARLLGTHAVRLHRDELEVNAYHTQAQVAEELGLRYRGMGVDPRTGERETREQTLARVQASITYAEGRLPSGADAARHSHGEGEEIPASLQLADASDPGEPLVIADPENTFTGAEVRHRPRLDEERFRPRSAPAFDGGAP